MRGWRSLALVLFVALAVGSAASRAEGPAYRIIVNPNNPITSVDRRFVEDAFLRKIKTWPDGEVLHPIDLTASSPLRQRWSEDVIRRPLAAVRAYWQQRIFSGRELPPPAVDNEGDVIKYVIKHDGGIGYLSASTPLGGAKAVSLR
jgi:hypothetical protein